MHTVKVAENCGFCFGVRRAVDMVYELRKNTDKEIYVIGELIHNGIFIERLQKDGIFCLEHEADIASLEDKKENVILVIRTHGVTKDVYEDLVSRGFEVIDATCPFVKRIHKIVDENTADGTDTLIIGDKNHPEVIGIQSYAHAETLICSDDKECFEFVKKSARNLEKPLLLVSQTTGNHEKYVNCGKFIKKVYTNAKIFDTICSVTENRQMAVAHMAQEADVMCVIGGTKSSNTRKLYEIASKSCDIVYLLETADDLPEKEFLDVAKDVCASSGRKFTVGITAGASTPDDIIEEVKVKTESLLEALQL